MQSSEVLFEAGDYVKCLIENLNGFKKASADSLELLGIAKADGVVVFFGTGAVDDGVAGFFVLTKTGGFY